MASNSDATYQQATYEGSTTVESSAHMNGGQRPRYDSNAVLMLPAPLAANKLPTSSASSVGVSRSSEENYLSDGASNSNQRLLSDQYSDSHDSSSSGLQHRLAAPSPYLDSPVPRGRSAPSSPKLYPPSPPEGNPFRSSMSPPVTYETEAWSPDITEETGGGRYAGGRGVQLMDAGPIAGPEGVRRVGRQSRRTSQTPASPQNRYSRNSGTFTLPPGAAPPQPYPPGAAPPQPYPYSGGSAY